MTQISEQADVPSKATAGRWLRRILAALVMLVLITEVGMRMAGMVDFPVYATDFEIGYVPRANQSGEFLNKNRWVLNDRSMNTAVRAGWRTRSAADRR